MTDPIRIVMGSDFHFGVPTMDQEGMAKAFAETIFPLLEDADIFFINGDFFDTLVQFDKVNFDPIYATIMNTLALCEKHGVILRVLQGTWEHDRNQLLRFETFHRQGGFTFNFKLHANIDLEEIVVRDRVLRIAYVPDDLPFKSSDDIIDVVKNKMSELGWDYVDYACMHGFSEFTLPKIGSSGRIVYRASQFDFVKKVVDMGHVHQHGMWGNIISNGSLDRSCFGDEAPKGVIRILDYEDRYTAHFVENKISAVFNTINLTESKDTVAISETIADHISKIKTDRQISLRFLIDNLEHRDAVKAWMKDNHPTIRHTFKTTRELGDKQIVIPSSELFTPIEKRVAPTPKTIASFVREHIPADYVITTDDIERYLEKPLDKP
jgi:hypothetical protein